MTGPALSREIVAMIADRADWLVDAVACSTQNRMFLRGEKECDAEACDSILLNGKQAITQVAQAQAAELERLRAALTEIAACLDGSPDYHTQGMGCGLEDRCITDRYEAMQYGWDEAIDRVYSEHVSGALEVAYAVLKGGTQ